MAGGLRLQPERDLVQTGAEGYAARFIIEDGQISAFTLHMRSYADTGESSSVLPDVRPRPPWARWMPAARN